jgi:hypothetical protein
MKCCAGTACRVPSRREVTEIALRGTDMISAVEWVRYVYLGVAWYIHVLFAGTRDRHFEPAHV